MMDFDSILLAKKLGGGGGGGSSTLINKNITANGTYNATDDSADGYKKVVVNVPNPSTGSLSITSNNTYDVTNYASAVVNVPNPSTGTLSVTANGTYDVTNYASANVNVSGAEWTSDGIAQNLEPNGAITLSSATSIANNAFHNKTAITSISGANVTSIGDSSFQSCTSLASISFPAVQTISHTAFRLCKLVSVSLPALTSCGQSVFQQNINTLTTLSLPSMTSCGSNFAYDCEKLASVDISSLATIPSGTFQQCYSLEVLDCPSVTRINQSAFYNARVLATLILRSDSVVTLDNVSAFTNTPLRGYNSLSGTIYVPSSLISSYQSATNWTTMYGEGHCTFSAIEGSIYE